MHKGSTNDMRFRFEKIVADIFDSYNFTTKLTSGTNIRGYDILAKKNNMNYIVEVKFSRTNQMPNSTLFDTACRLKVFCGNGDISNLNTPVLVVGAKIISNLRKRIENIGVVVLDIQNLLFLVRDNEDLKGELLSILDFSVNDLLPDKPNTQIFKQGHEFVAPSKTKGELLKERVSNWKNSIGNAAYEDLCFETLNYLFNDELSLWHRQKTSSSQLYRLDLICKIKDGDVSGLWTTILQCFNSKYIIFEFKNYKEKITQKEIYTTDKYLYLKALRGVAVLVSCKGASTNANKAIRGTLRENGKLIISVSNADLLKMIDIKMNEGVPADYLYQKFDELLIDWIYRCAESACPVFWKSPVRKEGITVPDKIMNAAETPS